jgi:hypothetical protein
LRDEFRPGFAPHRHCFGKVAGAFENCFEGSASKGGGEGFRGSLAIGGTVTFWIVKPKGFEALWFSGGRSGVLP